MTITLTREEAQELLNALTMFCRPNEDQVDELVYEGAIELLRAKLSAPEPEPYGYIARRNWKMPVFIEADNVEATNLPYNNPDYEPVFKASLQREWQSLTDEDYDEIFVNNQPCDWPGKVADKLREKNT